MRFRIMTGWMRAWPAALMLLIATPSLAQFSDSYNFLKAVKDKDGTKVTEFLSNSDSTIVNTKDYNSGEGALAIVVKRRDDQWLSFLIAKGANPNIKDAQGNTPLMLAAQIGFIEGISTLVNARAGVNIANGRGETPLIVAVQRRDAATVRILLANGADPKIADHLAGMSARDYAERDARAGAILKMIDDAAKLPKAAAPQVAGPKL